MSDIPIIHGYSIGQLFDKTILAERKVYIYNDAVAGAKPIGYVSSGQPIGVLYSWLGVNPAAGRERIWLMFYPPNEWSNNYYVPYNDGDFDWSNIQQQGAITVLQQQEQANQEQQDAETPWYEKLANWIGEGVKGDIIKPIVTTGLVVGAVYLGAVFVLPAVLKAFDKGAKKEA